MPTKSGKKTTAKKNPDDRKLFIIDTNVLLHDPTAIWNFEENDLAIPITVLEEVESFKKGTDIINFHAREVVRHLDDLSAKGSLTREGVSLGEGLGNIRVLVSGSNNKQVLSNFIHDNADHRILATALTARDENPNREVVLVSKDVSLRLKARSLDLKSGDYESDKVANIDELYTGKYILEDVDSRVINKFFSEPYYVSLAEFGIDEPFPNAFFIIRNHAKSCLARYNYQEKVFYRVEKQTAFGITPRNSEQTFALDALYNPEIRLVTLSGKAGTGKTLLALAGALECRRKYHQILLARPIIPLSNKDIGYLPGDIKDKIDPYMQPLWDNFGVIRAQFSKNEPVKTSMQNMLDTEKLIISPLTYIRGRSLNNIFFIVDEAQNLTGHEVKTIITRAGEGTKIIFTGDPQQIDTPYLDSRSNGLSRLIDRMKGQSIYAHITLEKGERSELADLASTLL